MKVGLHIADFTYPSGPAGLADDLTRVVVAAEEAGFARISVMDHLWQIPADGPAEHDMLEAYTTLGFIAARTSRVELLAWVTAVTYRHPGMLAKLVSTLDVLSKGRAWLGLGDSVVYPYWRLIYLLFAGIVIFSVFAFLHFTTFGMVVRAGMADRETVGLLGINVERRFTIVFGIAAVVAGLAVLSFVVVVVGGMGSLAGAVSAGFLLGILQSFASMNEIKSIIPGIDQIIIYLVAVIILLVRPRGLMGRQGVMED